MEIGRKIFFGFAILFLIEQVFYWFLGSYPYRLGLLIKKISIPDLSMSDWDLMRQERGSLSIKVNNMRKEVYLRYKYPFGIFGPLLFVGQIDYNNSDILKIRVGPLSAIFILYVLISPLFSGNFHQLINSFIIALIVGWFYLRLLTGYRSRIDKLRGSKHL